MLVHIQFTFIYENAVPLTAHGKILEEENKKSVSLSFQFF